MRITVLMFVLCVMSAASQPSGRGAWSQTRATCYYHFLNGESYANYNNSQEVVRLGRIVHQPVRESVSLNLQEISPLAATAQTLVYDLLGRFVVQLDANVGIESNTLAKSGLGCGAYLVVSRRENGSITTRLVSVQ